MAAANALEALTASTLRLSIRPGHAVLREKAAPENLDEFIPTTWKTRRTPALGAGVVPLGQGVASHAPEAFASEVRHVVELPDHRVGAETIAVKVRPPLR